MCRDINQSFNTPNLTNWGKNVTCCTWSGFDCSGNHIYSYVYLFIYLFILLFFYIFIFVYLFIYLFLLLHSVEYAVQFISPEVKIAIYVILMWFWFWWFVGEGWFLSRSFFWVGSCCCTLLFMRILRSLFCDRQEAFLCSDVTRDLR